MTIRAKYVHTNLIAEDWKRLATFYERVFGCVPLLPERDLSGEWLEAATGVPQARIRGMHLRLPGYGDEGPTLEVFQYNRQMDPSKPVANPASLFLTSTMTFLKASPWLEFSTLTFTI